MTEQEYYGGYAATYEEIARLRREDPHVSTAMEAFEAFYYGDDPEPFQRLCRKYGEYGVDAACEDFPINYDIVKKYGVHANEKK